MSKASTSINDETQNEMHSGGAFARSQSVDSSNFDNDSYSRRTNSFHVRPNSFCRQSSLISKTSEENKDVVEDDKEEKPKLIQNSRQLVILIGMAIIEFSGTCGMSVIAPFFPTEVDKIDFILTVYIPF